MVTSSIFNQTRFKTHVYVLVTNPAHIEWHDSFRIDATLSDVEICHEAARRYADIPGLCIQIAR